MMPFGNTFSGWGWFGGPPSSLTQVLVSVLVLATIAASPYIPGVPEDVRADEVEQLIRAGRTAYHEGNLERAAELLTHAEALTNEPRRTAFDLAAVRYQQALEGGEGSEEALREATQLFRCCLDPQDSRRPAALYGRGNCLLHRGSLRSSREDLQAALACYRRCLEEADANSPLARNARHNLQKTQLILLQVLPSASDPPEEDPPGQEPRDPTRPEPRNGEEPGEEPGSGERSKKRTGEQVTPKPGQEARPTDQEPQPGAGKLPPVPDQAEPLPLSREEALEHLRRATQRILQERRSYRAGKIKPVPGVRDW